MFVSENIYLLKKKSFVWAWAKIL